jgi:hypothetical protein
MARDLVLIRWTFDDWIGWEGPMPRWLAELIVGEVGHYGDPVKPGVVDEHPRRSVLVPVS